MKSQKNHLGFILSVAITIYLYVWICTGSVPTVASIREVLHDLITPILHFLRSAAEYLSQVLSF